MCFGIGCGGQGDEDEIESTPEPDYSRLEAKTPGIFRQVFDADDATRITFTIGIPNTYTGDDPVPLVVALHWGDQRIPPFFGDQLLRGIVLPAFHDLNAIFIAPDALGNSWTDPRNEKNVAALVEEVASAYNIDKGKVLLTGFSMGGQGTWHLASRNQDLYSAAIPIAGRPSKDALEIEWKIPFYVIHSKRDAVVTIAATQAVVQELQRRGANVKFVELEDIKHNEAGRYVEHLRAAIPWLKQIWNMQ